MIKYQFARSNSRDLFTRTTSIPPLSRSKSINSVSSTKPPLKFSLSRKFSDWKDYAEEKTQNRLKSLKFVSQDKNLNLESLNLKNKPSKLERQQDLMRQLEELMDSNKLEEWLKKHRLITGVNIEKLREQLEHFLEQGSINKIQLELPKWKKLLGDLKELESADNLEKWLESLDVPHEINIPEMKAKIKKFFLEESLKDTTGKSLVYQENTIAKKVWDDFRELSPAKQVIIVAAITAVTTIVGFVSLNFLALMLPQVVISIGAASAYVGEVLSQAFTQRQESAYNLLIDHTEKLKPLSSSWADQFILWKYL